MPAFTATTGLPLAAWIDARTNPNPRHPIGYARVVAPATVTITCEVGGVVGPLDSDPVMSGMIFSSVLSMFSVSAGGGVPPQITQNPGQSSVTHVLFDTTHRGHHTVLVAMNPNGGGITVPINVE